MNPPMGHGGYGSATYGQPAPDARGRDNQAQGGGWPNAEAVAPQVPPAPVRRSRRGLIIGLILLVVVIVVAIGGYVGYSLTNSASSFTVGSCVKQDGGGAVSVACDSPGAYKIMSIEDAESGCTDANQPTLVLTQLGGGKKYACLAPAAR